MEDAPTIEAKQIVHAHWIEHREFYEDEGFEGCYYSCSNCDGTLYGDLEGFNFCHCCGAQMDEVAGDINVGSKKGGITMIKRVMISQPMNGISEGKIKKTRREAVEKLEKEGYEVVQSYFTEEWIGLNAGGIKNKALWCLAKSLEVMSHCDTVYFCDGWQEARGCRIEHEAAIAYGLEIYEELSFPRSHENDNHIAGPGKKGVKIPVISMEDVPKVMEELLNK